ncbi:MAG: hypothetical protein P1U56_03125 [Saprospiraceae bacterium]|nr:hypothetical protein [Saprospiraceae bacterium]
MRENEKENIESLAREYLQNSGNDYLTILSDMRKKGHDEETTMQVFERYETLRAQQVDQKTIEINTKEKEKLKYKEGPFIWALIIGFICFGIALFSNSIVSIIILFAGSCLIGYIQDKRKPLALIMGCFVFFLLVGPTMELYFEGRATRLRLEGALYMCMSIIPAYLIYDRIKKATN